MNFMESQLFVFQEEVSVLYTDSTYANLCTDERGTSAFDPTRLLYLLKGLHVYCMNYALCCMLLHCVFFSWIMTTVPVNLIRHC